MAGTLAASWAEADAMFRREPLIRRASPMLITAPHAVTHIRDGRTKVADIATGGLAVLLAELLGASSLTLSQSFVEAGDWSNRSDAFATALAELLPQSRFVIDLHGMADHHGTDICLGEGRRPTATALALSAQVGRALTGAGFTVTRNRPFAARAAHTVVDRVQRAGGDALQIEITSRLRKPREHPEAAGELVATLAGALRDAMCEGDESGA